MELGFTEKNNWTLPNEGTLGNKAKNLLENRVLIESHGFKIPRSLVIPFEYLETVDNRGQFTLSQIDTYFPNWLRVFVRSNSPDEDLDSRVPGQYVSESIWHKEREHAETLIYDVLNSYNFEPAKLRRKHLGLDELSMCLLIQEPVSNTLGGLDSFHSGVFSDIGELALLNFTRPSAGTSAMMESPIHKYWVDSDGGIEEAELTVHQDLAKKLRRLSDALPYNEGKGWEIEFASSIHGDYVIQTTPIVKRDKLVIPDNIENIFDCIAVVGTGKVITDGILYVPFRPSIEELIKFDTTHKNYCLVSIHPNLVPDGYARYILPYLENPTAIIDIKDVFFQGHPYAAHIEQYMREGRVALAGTFNNEFKNILIEGMDYTNRKGRGDLVLEGIIYSPTKLLVIADEMTKKGIAAVEGKIHDFVPVGGV